MPRDRRMSCTAVIGISSQIQRLKKMIGPMTEKTVFAAILRRFSTISAYGGVNCQGLSPLPRLGRQVLCFKGKPVFFICALIFYLLFSSDG